MNLLPFLLLRLIHYIMISLLKRTLLLIPPNVLMMWYSLCLRLDFQLLLRWNLMTSGNWLQQSSRSPVSWIHYHLLSSNNVRTYCCLLLLTSSTSLFVKAACLRVWNLQYCRPLLKKPDADVLQFKNFRPISKLKALSKVNEKSVALQLNTELPNEQ